MMYACALAGIAQGANVGWFYQGLEQMRIVSVVDILGKVMFALSVFFLIHSPGDDWKVPCIQCFWYCAATIILTARIYRDFAVGKPSIKTAAHAIKRSASMFLYRGSLTLYTTANTLILGFLSTPLSVAYYAAGEKINNVLLNGGTPVTQALFPKMSYLTVNDPQAARRIARNHAADCFGHKLGALCGCLSLRTVCRKNNLGAWLRAGRPGPACAGACYSYRQLQRRDGMSMHAATRNGQGL